MKIIGYCVFGLDHQVPLWDYAGLTERDVRLKIEDGMRREKFAGTVQQRMEELRWVIWPLALGLSVIDGQSSPITRFHSGRGTIDPLPAARAFYRVHELITIVQNMGWRIKVSSIPLHAYPAMGPDPRITHALKDKYAYKEIVDALELLGPDIVSSYEIFDGDGNGRFVRLQLIR